MGKHVVGIIAFLLISCVVFGGSLQEVCQKLPNGTYGFIGTSGTDNFKADFDGSVLGQIAADPQVKTFFEQIMASVSTAPDFQNTFGQGEDAIAFAKGLLASPTVLAIVPTSDTLTDEPSVVLLASPITRDSDQGKLLLKMLAEGITTGRIVEKQMHGCTTFVSNDPNCTEPYYMSLANDCFVAAFNDGQYSILQGVVSNPINYEIASELNDVPATNEAAVLYFDLQKLIAILNKEATNDPDVQMAMEAFRAFGIADMQHYLFKVGFRDTNMVIDGKLKMPTTLGIWNTFFALFLCVRNMIRRDI